MEPLGKLIIPPSSKITAHLFRPRQLTYIIAVKRHHIRFFGADRSAQEGRNQNIVSLAQLLAPLDRRSGRLSTYISGRYPR